MYKKMFLVAIGGKSVDGRDLPNEDIFAIAENYNPELYTATIIRNLDYPRASPVLGSVKKLEAVMVAGKARLYAEIEIGSKLLEIAEEWSQPHYFAVYIAHELHPKSGCGLPTPYLFNLVLDNKENFKGIDAISYPTLKACMQPDVVALETGNPAQVDKHNIPSITFTRQRYYRNGAHAGDIYYGVVGWGMNGPKDEAILKELISEAISHS
ncbi:hypothetical protein M988_3044 [Hafnia paralvei ATCC 29927]|uniref:GPO family capsid scaffolding protein n=1 Tax=Hafnia paralvei TaxID=546367 RepID=UPI0007E36733|nr:GPO family capsid scaffolding protein [Hafnia paralvei]OAT39939.1 hypothetical protein M988_3044 [Hafnia paralvei ATCC 29927]